jgi:Asp-tRNA(Asn)/Glu-tRNA(Gln) amidotransferase A subunit family amidase
MLWIESSNAIFGRACNPWDPSRTTGGSSGGEGGLIASRCSPIGIGTDVGGSIRTPAAWCGTYAFKPTPERTSR